MPADQHSRRTLIAEGDVPRLARHAKLRFDEARQTWLLLAPEKILTPSETAVEVLKLCDGARTVTAIAADLAREYEAPPAAILADILPLLQGLADKGYVET